MDSTSPLAQRIAGLPGNERRRALLDLVRTQVSDLLGFAVPEDAADVSFLDLGIDSLTAVDLRDRLGAAGSLNLPSTMVFDHPTPAQLAGYLDSLLDDAARAHEAPAPDGARKPAAGEGPESQEEHGSREPERHDDDPIVIVGMACHFAGGVDSPEDLWRLLAAGAEAHGPLPQDRGWDLEALYDSDPDVQGTTYVREGGFLDRAQEFDAAFFGISPREALAMDPQQRLLLETSWEALEQAGIDPATLRGSRTAVYAGVADFDYPLLATAVPDSDMYYTTGTHSSVASGRISYALGLEGAALTVDTACSSSLVTLHLAAQALRQGECSMALAGGATVLAGPSVYLGFSRQRALSADGRCRAFSDNADGFGPAEGVGMLVLERLSDARRNGHRVWAVVRGSAVNQDGASNGLTAPNGPSQQRVIRQALAVAGLSVADVDVVEAHGTGTALGDPIEAQALLATYGQRGAGVRPLLLGSVKSNIGHTQAAAGVAGVIKSVLALERGVVPASLHARVPSSHVDWDAGAVELAAEAVAWPEVDRPRRAGVSSFGMGGTNAHVILEQALDVAAGTAADTAPERGADTGDVALPGGREGLGGLTLWPVSGRGEGALRAQAGRLAEFLRTGPSVPDASVAAALAQGRTAFEHRGVILADSRDAAVAGLEALASGNEKAALASRLVPPSGSTAPDASSGAVVTGTALASSGEGVVLVFPGQGSQWVGMGRQLIDFSPVFADWVAECEKVFAPYLDWSLSALLRDEGSTVSLDQGDEVVQPALFTVMTGLAELWRHYGVVPAAVVGHSQGEIAAAYVAGALSLPDAAKIVALRSKLLKELSGRGAMASVMLGRAETEAKLTDWAGRLSVAAVNSPSSTAVSGDAGALGQFLDRLAADGVWARRIPIDYASHSAHAEVVEERLAELLADIVPRSGDVVFCSTVTGELIDTAALGAGYWYRNLREPVDFQGAVESLLAAGYRVFVEASPHPVLTMAVEQILDGASREGVALESLRRDHGGPEHFAGSLAQAQVRGVDLDWTAVLGAVPARVDLPTYAFQRDRFWPVPAMRQAGDPAGLGVGGVDHPLLGAVVESADGGGVLLTGRLSLATHPWLADHAVAGTALLPGTAFLELMLRAGEEVGCAEVTELVLELPLVLPDDGGVRIQVAVGAEDDSGHRTVTVHSRPEDGPPGLPWTRHAGGLVAVTGATGPDDPAGLGDWPPAGARPVPLDDFAARIAERGYGYGPAFQGLRAVWRRGEELFAEIGMDEDLIPGDRLASGRPERFALHPALLDAALRPMLLNGGLDDTAEGPWLPFSWSGFRVYAAGADRLRVRLTPQGPGAVAMELADGAGRPVASAQSLVTRPVPADRLRAAHGDAGQALLHLDWRALNTEARTAPATEGWATLGAADPDARYGGVPVTNLTDLAALRARLDAGHPAPDVLLVARSGPAASGAAVPDAVAAGTVELLGVLQEWLADERCTASRLVVLTCGATATGPDEDVTGLAAAPLWGLVRSAQAENPGRFILLDTDGTAESRQALPAALAAAIDAGEPQLALRAGQSLVPRLAPHPTDGAATLAAALDPQGTLLVTGGTGTLGGVLARHLVRRYGLAHVVLTSRSGRAATDAAALEADLVALGAKVTIAACDAADRTALAELLDTLPAEHPLTGVVHAAGVLADGVLPSLTADQVARVLDPKVRAAWNLHELTRDRDLALFAMFSSVAGVIGTAGQANYAAANSFLDALAVHRRAQNLPATSLAWGFWSEATGMTRHIDQDGMAARLRRIGIRPLPTDQGLALFDTATATTAPALVPAPLDHAALRAGTPDSVPALLRGLVRVPVRRTAAHRPEAETGGLAQRLLAAAPAERERILRKLVQSEVHEVLGAAQAENVAPDRRFSDLGFDSLTTVELRNRLTRATGLRLPTTLVFDHPTAADIARFLHDRLIPENAEAPETAAPTGPTTIHRPDTDTDIAAMDVDELIRLALDDNS